MTPEHFRNWRRGRGLTQKSLGAFLGISTRQIKRYEKGVSEIPGPLAILIDILIDKRIPKILS
jgi:transcriptional regulator with XRE-family HTH domain